jgi:hypothetical protein
MEELIRQIGSCHSSDVDKYDRFALALCRPGGRALSAAAGPACDVDADAANLLLRQRSMRELSVKERKERSRLERLARSEAEAASRQRALDRNAVALSACVAHLVCEVISLCEERVRGHGVYFCRVTHAFVRRRYWDGKCFAPRDAATPPYLTFFGSGRFGCVRVEPEEMGNSNSTDAATVSQ